MVREGWMEVVTGLRKNGERGGCGERRVRVRGVEECRDVGGGREW